jgi:hypothetical protein
MPTYAAGTDVSPDRSRAEIERTLQRYGATGFLYGWKNDQAMLGFEMAGRQLRFHMALPDRQSDAFQKTPTGKRRTANSAQEAFEQATRQRWRALALVIKAKLEAVESGIATFEEEFLAHIVLPDGQTVGQWMLPQVERAYLTGHMPALLPQIPARTGDS